MKKIIISIFVLSIPLIFFAPTIKKQFSEYRLRQSDEEFARTVTRDDMEQIYQDFFYDSGFGWITGRDISFMEGKPIYIIENQYIDKLYNLRHKDRRIIIISREDFNEMQSKTGYIIGCYEITNVEYTGDRIDEKKYSLTKGHKNSVTLFYRKQNYINEGSHGFTIYAKEKGKWIGYSGFSMS